MENDIGHKVEQIEHNKPKIIYFSLHELNHPHEDYVNIPNYISLWAQKMKEVDPDGKKAREIANKYIT